MLGDRYSPDPDGFAAGLFELLPLSFELDLLLSLSPPEDASLSALALFL
jgi:hypothetical protein